MDIFDALMTVLAIVLAIVSSFHALISKRDPKSAIGWIAFCVLIPFGGPFLYYIFGINRVRTRAEKLQRRSDVSRGEIKMPTDTPDIDSAIKDDDRTTGKHAELVHLSDTITDRALVGGNHIEVLNNGEEAYPAMLDAIENARRSLFLTTYIFESNDTGKTFVDALAGAVKRGVDVKVIVDGLSDACSLNWCSRQLKKAGVPVARFLPPRLIPPTASINLRNHRKILVADGTIAFTGGINIGDRHLAERYDNPDRVVDMHFRLTGPVVQQIEKVFIDDWRFITGIDTPPNPVEPKQAGSALCRVITEGPNEDMDTLAMILAGAISAARESVVIMTPYFIPTRGLLAVLQAAALRGLQVTIILPEKNDIRILHWATRNLLWELLERGVKIYYQPPPFVHTKLVIIDEYYTHIGSANIDPRSLRLNFELVVEIFDTPLAEILTKHVETVIEQSQPVTLEDVDGRSFPARLRDSLAWLLSPYL